MAKAIDGFRSRKKAESLAAVDALAPERAFTLRDLVGGAFKAKASARAANYRHPENPSVAWSGEVVHLPCIRHVARLAKKSSSRLS